MKNILQLLEENSRLTPEELAAMCDMPVAEVKTKIAEWEKDGTILAYHTLVDWDKTDREYVCALIELKVSPQRNYGFDNIAEQIVRYPEVQSLYLMSGSFDLSMIVEGKSMREVAFFVSEKLATLDAVVSTATHFLMKRYKNNGVIYQSEEPDQRGNCL